MRVKVKAERTTVEEAEVELELPDGTDLEQVDWPKVLYEQMVSRPDGGYAPDADWELNDENFDLVGGEEPEVLP